MAVSSCPPNLRSGALYVPLLFFHPLHRHLFFTPHLSSPSPSSLFHFHHNNHGGKFSFTPEPPVQPSIPDSPLSNLYIPPATADTCISLLRKSPTANKALRRAALASMRAHLRLVIPAVPPASLQPGGSGGYNQNPQVSQTRKGEEAETEIEVQAQTNSISNRLSNTKLIPVRRALR